MITERFPTIKIPQSQLQILVQQFEGSMQFASGTTTHVYRKALDQLLRYAKSNTFRFTPNDFSQFRIWLFNRRKLCNNTVNTYLTASRRFCEFLVELGVLKKNPTWSVHGSAQNFKILGLKLEEVESRISAIDRTSVLGKRDYAFISLMFECGAKISELINADVGDMKRSGQTVELWVKTKGARGESEIIRLTDFARTALFDYIDSRGRVAVDDPLFGTVRAGRALGVRLSFRGARAAMQKHLKFDEEKSLRLDSLRTYCAVRLMSEGKTPEEIRSYMRFKSNMPLRKLLNHRKATAEIK